LLKNAIISLLITAIAQVGMGNLSDLFARIYNNQALCTGASESVLFRGTFFTRMIITVK
jgi:hypothetical protein